MKFVIFQKKIVSQSVFVSHSFCVRRHCLRDRVATRSACYRGRKPQDCPTWLGEGARKDQKLLHWCKRGLHWCKRLLGDRFSNWPKHLLRPLLTALGNFEFPASVTGTRGRKARVIKIEAGELTLNLMHKTLCNFKLQTKPKCYVFFGFFRPPLPREIAEANSRQFHCFSPRFSSTLHPF